MIHTGSRSHDQPISGVKRLHTAYSLGNAGIDIVPTKLRLAERVNLEDDPDAGVELFVTERTVEAPGPS
jgi:hypothetical protein